jgi:damage-control phosphatase, subfamily III
LWNKSLIDLKNEIGEENFTWFKAPWLYSECYLYRRIREAMMLSKSSLRFYDPFEQAKCDSYKQSLETIFDLIIGVCPLNFESVEKKNENNLLNERFRILVESMLWANKNDLSLSSGKDVSEKVKNLIDLIESFKANILCDHTRDLWDFFSELKRMKNENIKSNIRIDIVLDNCSIEFASDLLMCDFLLRNGFVDSIHLHAKLHYWFISDVTKNDFDYFFKLLQSSNSLIINQFYKRISGYLENSKIILNSTSQFWTSPYEFNKMEEIDRDLYLDLKANSSLVIFKGDLNYRKLLGDLNWPYDTKLSVALRNFRPTSICAIRTLKADLCVNIDLDESTNPAIKEARKNPKWMISGEYGIIQLAALI